MRRYDSRAGTAWQYWASQRRIRTRLLMRPWLARQTEEPRRRLKRREDRGFLRVLRPLAAIDLSPIPSTAR
jgi:hypothetical protein